MPTFRIGIQVKSVTFNEVLSNYRPRVLNIETDRESRNLKDSSELKLKIQVFRKICQPRVP